MRQSPRMQKSPAKIGFFCGRVLVGSLSVRTKCWLVEQILPKIGLLCVRVQGRLLHSPKIQVTHMYTSCIYVYVYFFGSILCRYFEQCLLAFSQKRTSNWERAEQFLVLNCSLSQIFLKHQFRACTHRYRLTELQFIFFSVIYCFKQFSVNTYRHRLFKLLGGLFLTRVLFWEVSSAKET